MNLVKLSGLASVISPILLANVVALYFGWIAKWWLVVWTNGTSRFTDPKLTETLLIPSKHWAAVRMALFDTRTPLQKVWSPDFVFPVIVTIQGNWPDVALCPFMIRGWMKLASRGWKDLRYTKRTWQIKRTYSQPQNKGKHQDNCSSHVEFVHLTELLLLSTIITFK